MTLPSDQEIDESLERFSKLPSNKMRARLALMLQGAHEAEGSATTDDKVPDNQQDHWEPDLVAPFPENNDGASKVPITTMGSTGTAGGPSDDKYT